VAGQSGRNLKIVKSRLGAPRFPFENPAVGDGYAGAGPVIVRQMTPEERARYGPAKPCRDDSAVRARLLEAVKISDSPEEAADLLNITVAQLNRYLAFRGIRPRWGGMREVENVETIETYGAETTEAPPAPEKICKQPEEPVHATPQEQGEPAQKTKLELALERLPKEKYVELKNQGLTDGEICRRYDIDEKTTLYRMKKKWGLLKKTGPTRLQALKEKLTKEEYLRLKNQRMTDREILKSLGLSSGQDVLTLLKTRWGLAVDATRPVKVPEEVQDKQGIQPVPSPPAGLTVARAIQIRDELAEDIDSLNIIIDMLENNMQISDRVAGMLFKHRDWCQQELGRINEALEKTVVEL
jgi:transposase-like protein